MFRKHTHTYSKGYLGASAMRDRVNRIDDTAEYRKILDDFFGSGALA